MLYRTCLCLISVLSVVYAANLGYSPRHLPQRLLQQQQQQPQQQQGQAYYYDAPSTSTMQALRRIIQGHLQRFQLADRQRALLLQSMRNVEMYRPLHVPLPAASQLSLEYAVPPNSPTPKNYAMNFLPEGKDVAPGTSYIPLKLLRIRR